MSKLEESGHAKNAASFDSLIGFIQSWGPDYNPSKPSLQINGLQSLQFNVRSAIENLHSFQAASSTAIAARDDAFKPFSKLVTRIINAVKVSDATPQVIDNVQTLVRKLQGRRATAKKTDDEKKELSAKGIVVNEKSSSQMSFDSRLDSFDKLLKLLNTIRSYNPNETELKLEGLYAFLVDLKDKNTTVLQVAVQLSNTRIKRNQLMYTVKTGMVDIALDTKVYVKSAFGTDDERYKQIAPIPFKNYNL